MNPIPVLGIAILNRADLLKRCLQSIDYPVDKLVIVDNSDSADFNNSVHVLLDEVQRNNPNILSWRHNIHPNVGCAGSWNEIIIQFPAPYWMMVGNDIQFAPGDLENMARAVDANSDASFLFANHGHSFFIWTALGVNTIGLADQNIYPAYTEDVEMSYRVKLTGARCVDVQGIKSVHGEAPSWGSTTIHSDPSYRKQNGGTHGRNWKYYEAKWGSKVGEETFKTPFGIPGCPIDYMPFQLGFRAMQQWK